MSDYHREQSQQFWPPRSFMHGDTGDTMRQAAIQVVFVDPLQRIVEAVSAVIDSFDGLVAGTEVAESVDDAVQRLRRARSKGLGVALIAPRNAMPDAPARDTFRREAGLPFAESVDVLAAIVGRMDEPLPVIIPHLFVDSPAELSMACRERGLDRILIAKTADITDVGSSLDHRAVLTVIQGHLRKPTPGVRRLDRLVRPKR